VSLTINPHPLTPGARRPANLAELVEVHDDMLAALGDPEHMDSPKARALFLLDADRIRATRTEQP
jgi:hypothetical protein